MANLKVGDHVGWNKRDKHHGDWVLTPMTGIVEKVGESFAIVRPDGNNQQRVTIELSKLSKIS